MTDREIAHAVAMKWMPGKEPDNMQVIALTAHIEIALGKARMLEREECAAVADEHRADAKANGMYPAYGLNSQAMAAGNIADAIRARGAK